MPRDRQTLSLVLITRDEADRIARCIRSIPRADEIVVLDSGSTDQTVAIARSHGARVIETDWPGFVAQKNRALREARGDWVLSLDADEWLEDAAHDALCAALAQDRDGWTFARCSRWQGRRIRHGRWYPDRRLRLVRRARARWVGDEPVDRLVVDGPTGDLPVDIEHDPYRSFREHLRTIDRYTAAAARTAHTRRHAARRRDPVVHGTWHLVDSLVLRQGWRDGWRGVALAGLGAVHSGLKWHRMRR
jgi:glycosyltransferase involved in cell wall biosynthesis